MNPAPNAAAAFFGEVSTASSSNNNRKKRIPPYAQIPGSLGSSSGYAGDLESMNNSSRLPASIELTSRQKKRYAIIDIKPLYPQGKRPKPTKEELNFMAMNTKEDMEKGGLVPARRRPRVFPPQSKVDMSLVQIISSSTYDKEKKANGTSSSAGTSDHHEAVALLDQFEQVAMEVAHCYRPVQFNDLRLKQFREGVQKAKEHNDGLKQQPQQDAGFQSDSSSSSAATSSFTESDGGEEETGRNTSNTVSVMSPSPVGEEDAFSQENVDANDNADDGCQLISLEKALSFSERPKIVALSTAPHLIIYANAAFQRAIGPAQNVVGKATSHVFADTTLSSAMSMVVDAGQRTIVTGQCFHTTNSSSKEDTASSNKAMTLSVFPVGSPADQVTTYLGIEVTAVEEAASVASMTVMG